MGVGDIPRELDRRSWISDRLIVIIKHLFFTFGAIGVLATAALVYVRISQGLRTFIPNMCSTKNFSELTIYLNKYFRSRSLLILNNSLIKLF